VRLLENVLAYNGAVVMTTITAPTLPWDCDGSTHPGLKCSGKLGCRVVDSIAGDFNWSASERYSKLHKAAAQATYREYGAYPVRLAYSPELQSRGVIHWHVVLGFRGPGEARRARFYVRKLHELSGDYGYGFIDRKLRATPCGKAAAYVSKYLTEESKPGAGLREVVLDGTAPSRPVYVSQRLTATTRCTMRNLRRRRAAYMLWRVHWSLATTEWVFELLRYEPEVFERAFPVSRE